MKAKSYRWMAAVVAILSMLTSALFADVEPTEHEVEQAYLSTGEEKVSSKIEAEFTDFAGDEAGTLVESLRTGDSLSYVIEVEQVVLDDEGNPVLIEVTNEDGTVSTVEKTELVEEIVVVDNAAGAQGFGGIVLALGLAEATLPEGSGYEDIVKALFDSETGEGILDMRADGRGWGEIYQSFDLKVGEIMRDKHSSRPEKMDHPGHMHPDKPEKPEKPEKPDRPEKPEKPERAAKPEKPEKPGKPAHAGGA